MSETNFILSSNTQIKMEGEPLRAVTKIVNILKRDIETVFEAGTQ